MGRWAPEGFTICAALDSQDGFAASCTPSRGGRASWVPFWQPIIADILWHRSAQAHNMERLLAERQTQNTPTTSNTKALSGSTLGTCKCGLASPPASSGSPHNTRRLLNLQKASHNFSERPLPKWHHLCQCCWDPDGNACSAGTGGMAPSLHPKYVHLQCAKKCIQWALEIISQ